MNAYQQYLLEEFIEDYRERHLERRDLIKRAVLMMGGAPAAAVALLTLGCGSSSSEEPARTAVATTATGSEATPAPSPAALATVPATDAAVQGSDISFAGPGSDIKAYLARPAAAGTYPGVIVIHENRGLLEHFKDVSRRYAKEGFVALAPDLLSRQGGTGTDANTSAGSLGGANIDELTADLVASVAHLKSQTFVRPTSLGVTGFCFGGGYTWDLALASPELKAAVPYYGTIRQMDRLGEINAAVLAIYGQNDTRITAQSGEALSRLQAAGKTAEVKVYPGANHAFFNDTGGSYNAEAARDAWATTIAWFRRYLTA